MTVLDTSTVEHSVPPAFRPAELSRMSRWRLASRLARREVRRRPGRTVLITLLIAVPVFAMTVASVIGRTQTMSPDQQYQRNFGASDLRVQVSDTGDASSGAPLSVFSDQELTGLLPKGSIWERSLYGYGTISDATQGRYVPFMDFDLESPMFAGFVEVNAGRAPRSADEIALDADTANGFGVGIGDQLTLVSPAGTWTVTGFVRKVDAFNANLLVFGQFDHERVAPMQRIEQIYITLPPGASISPETATALASHGDLEVRPSVAASIGFGTSFAQSSLNTETLAWGWVVGALALAIVSIIIASAFATSARRQLATIGQLSANGANQRLLRRTLGLQGAWSGAIGSTAGIAVALMTLAGLRGMVDRVIARHLGSYDIAVSDLVVIFTTGVIAATIAALVPARSAARVPVIAALAGRRPLNAVPRRLLPIGIGLFAGGLFMLAVAAAGSTSHSNGNIFAVVAIVGGFGVLAGMCCLTPLTIDFVGRVGAHLSASWRLSARSLARTRTRSAAVVAAIAAAASLAVGGSTFISSREAESSQGGSRQIDPVPKNAVIITNLRYPAPTPEVNGFVDVAALDPIPVPADVLSRVANIADGVIHTRRVAVWNPAPVAIGQPDIAADGTLTDAQGSMVIADPFVLDMLGLSPADRALLAKVGATALDTWQDGTLVPGATQTREVDIEGTGKRRYQLVGLAGGFRSYAGVFGTLITPESASALGLQIVDEATVILTPQNLTDSQRIQLAILTTTVGELQIFDRPATEAGNPSPGEQVIIAAPSPILKSSANSTQLAIAAAALLFTLLVVAIGLGLSAAENRDERDVLIAIGARPRTMRRTSAQKTGYLTLAGALLAIPTGLLPIAIVLRSLGTTGTPPPPFAPDWTTIALVAFAMPLAAATITWIGAAIIQRAHPLHMSNLHSD